MLSWSGFMDNEKLARILYKKGDPTPRLTHWYNGCYTNNTSEWFGQWPHLGFQLFGQPYASVFFMCRLCTAPHIAPSFEIVNLVKEIAHVDEQIAQQTKLKLFSNKRNRIKYSTAQNVILRVNPARLSAIMNRVRWHALFFHVISQGMVGFSTA